MKSYYIIHMKCISNFKQKTLGCIFTLNVSLYTEAQTDAPIVEPTDVPTEEPDMSG